jgi:hypothetical protein
MEIKFKLKLTTATSTTSTSTHSHATSASSHAHWTTHLILGLWSSFLDIDFLATDCLFGCLQQVIDNGLRVECDEAKGFALVLLLIEWHFHLDDVSVLREISLNLLIANLGNESTDKDLSGACLSLLRVDLLVVDDVITGSDNLID